MGCISKFQGKSDSKTSFTFIKTAFSINFQLKIEDKHGV